MDLYRYCLRCREKVEYPKFVHDSCTRDYGKATIRTIEVEE
jgi:hypothetical protein